MKYWFIKENISDIDAMMNGKIPPPIFADWLDDHGFTEVPDIIRTKLTNTNNLSYYAFSNLQSGAFANFLKKVSGEIQIGIGGGSFSWTFSKNRIYENENIKRFHLHNFQTKDKNIFTSSYDTNVVIGFNHSPSQPLLEISERLPEGFNKHYFIEAGALLYCYNYKE